MTFDQLFPDFNSVAAAQETARVGYVMLGGDFGIAEGHCVLSLCDVQVFPND